MAHDLNVVLSAADVAVRPLAGAMLRRQVQAATARGHDTPMIRAVLAALREVAAARGARPGSMAPTG